MGRFPVKKIWLKQVPSKVCFFLWALARGRTLTIDNLKKRGKPMPSWYVMCEQEEETISHLFINYVTTRTMWNRLLVGFNLQLQGDVDISNWVSTRSAGRKSRSRKLIWEVLVHTVAWTIWLERN